MRHYGNLEWTDNSNSAARRRRRPIQSEPVAVALLARPRFLQLHGALSALILFLPVAWSTCGAPNEQELTPAVNMLRVISR